MPTLAPSPKTRTYGFSKASAYLPKSFIYASELESLSREEFTTLWRKFKKRPTEEVRNQLIEHFLPLVRATAERMHNKLPSHVDVDELIQAGVFGLMDAIDGFDPERGVKFEAYAKQRISGAILDDLRDQDFAPRLVRTHSHRMERAWKEIEAETGEIPEAHDVAGRLGISMEEYDRWMREISVANVMSLDRAATEHESEGKEVRKVDTIKDDKIATPMDGLERSELIELATRGLSMKERVIVVLYYLEELTMKEIGMLLNLSESRVCQIHHRIIEQLKQHLQRMRTDLMG